MSRPGDQQGRHVLGHAPSPCLGDILTLGSLLPHWECALPPVKKLGNFRASCRDARTLCNALLKEVHLKLWQGLDAARTAAALDQFVSLDALHVQVKKPLTATVQDHPSVQWLVAFMLHMRSSTLARIRRLTLYGLLLTQSVAVVIASMRQLQQLQLVSTRPSDIDVGVLSTCTHLRTIELEFVSSLDSWLAGLTAISSLRQLQVRCSSHTTVSLSSFAGLVQLTSLIVLTGAVRDVASLSSLVALQELSVHAAPRLTTVIAHMPQLTSLGVRRLDRDVIADIKQAGHQLQVLSVGAVGDGAADAGAGLLGSLTRLDFPNKPEDSQWEFVHSLLAAGGVPLLKTITVTRPHLYFGVSDLVSLAGTNLHKHGVTVCTHTMALEDGLTGVNGSLQQIIDAISTGLPMIQCKALKVFGWASPGLLEFLAGLMPKLAGVPELRLGCSLLDESARAVLADILQPPLQKVWVRDCSGLVNEFTELARLRNIEVI